MQLLTVLQMGDVHGHLLPRPNLRSDGTDREEGGLARLYAKVQELRRVNPNSLLVNTGDTIQGSAEALYTRGQALVDVIDLFGVDAYAPGNWDYLYGKGRFLDLFGPGTGLDGSACRWGAVAANVSDAETGNLIVPPYIVKVVAGVRVGILGLSSERAINALGAWVTEGLTFTADAKELPAYVKILRRQERVDLIVSLSEFGLAKNVLIANANPDVAVVLSSDMHEETPRAVVAASGAIVSEAGQDGTRLAQLDIVVDDSRITQWDYRLHVIDASIEADAGIESMIEAIRRPFLSGDDFVPHSNPLNGSILTTPIDTLVGDTLIGLHRSNFSDEAMPAAVEGSSANFLADAIRGCASVDVGHFRGFRFGTHVRPGPVRLEDLFHFIPIGPQIARTTVTGRQLKDDIERSADGTFNPDPFKWTGGWLNAYSGVHFDLDVYELEGDRASRITVQRATSNEWETLNASAVYSFAGFWYARDPESVGGVTATSAIEVINGLAGETIDATQAISEFVSTGPSLSPEGRITILRPLPAPRFGNPEIQPLAGTSGDQADL